MTDTPGVCCISKSHFSSCSASPKARDEFNAANWQLIGYDEFHPVSKQGRQMTPKGMGWIIVDSLDTLILMNLTSRFAHARKWMTTKLDYEQDKDVNTFETTIRM